MPTLPNAQLAILDIRKLTDYCLNPAHPRGRHKARVFREAAGIKREDAAWLRETLLRAVMTQEAVPTSADSLGTQWRADIPVARPTKSIVVRTTWIVRWNEDFPRFVSCWVL